MYLTKKQSTIYIYICIYKVKSESTKSKVIPLQTWTGSEGSIKLRLPEFPYNRYMNVVKPTLRTGHLYP